LTEVGRERMLGCWKARRLFAEELTLGETLRFSTKREVQVFSSSALGLRNLQERVTTPTAPSGLYFLDSTKLDCGLVDDFL
jgi:hypothetical protein